MWKCLRLIAVFSSLSSFSGSGKHCISGNVEMSDTTKLVIDHANAMASQINQENMVQKMRCQLEYDVRALRPFIFKVYKSGHEGSFRQRTLLTGDQERADQLTKNIAEFNDVLAIAEMKLKELSAATTIAEMKLPDSVSRMATREFKEMSQDEITRERHMAMRRMRAFLERPNPPPPLPIKEWPLTRQQLFDKSDRGFVAWVRRWW